jgi:lipoprotein-anchoring transpeptidase ErfK/SrfK
MRTRLPILFLAVVALSTGVVACGDDSGDSGDKESKRKSPASTTTTVPPFTSTIAEATGPEVQIFDAPESPTPSLILANPWHLNDDPAEPTVPQVFLVEEQRNDGWIRVLLPVRPNGASGWLHTSDVKLVPTRYHITIALGAHQITVYDGEAAILQEPVAVGAPDTPTPPGRYYIRVLLESEDPGSVYGPFAYGLSAHSDVLTSFSGGDAEVGIHGNNDASVLGQSVSHGCVRMSNEGVTRLTQLLPLGTPVEIVA